MPATHQSPQAFAVRAASKPWWNADTLLRLLCDLIRAELMRLRLGGLGLGALFDSQPGACIPNLDLDALDLDSLEFLDLATLVSTQFHLYQAEMENRLLSERHLSDWVRCILAGRACWDETLSFQTSGSTGRPKVCVHPMRFLEQEILWFADRFADRKRILTAVPAHHIYGFLFTAMLPALLEVPVRDLRPMLPDTGLRLARPGDLIVGHPAFFELATRSQPEIAQDVMALTSTARSTPELWRRLQVDGGVRLMEIYGSSENAGIGVREGFEAPFSLLPHWSRDPEDPTRIQRLDDQGEPIHAELQDHLEWLDAERFRVRGRRDGAVQVAGVNVFPERVESLLRQHPDVDEAWVRLASDDPGARLKAFVVPVPACAEPETLPERLHSWLAHRLSTPERPRSITIGKQLPRSPMGKRMDW